jgi:hypothetical protein
MQKIAQSGHPYHNLQLSLMHVCIFQKIEVFIRVYI